MALERTLAIIKPDAIQKGVIGEIIQKMEEANLKPIGIKMLHLDHARAEAFYAVHKEKAFFADLVNFMASGPIIVLCLEGENGVAKWRVTMGATNPDQAADGSLRKDYGSDVQCNAVHGSDGPDTAQFEINFFFEQNDLYAYEWV
ncbi:MAG: nucleoside-diphosphate kinase [Deltaproteobacteria bacterium]|nr:nucleoside-diphosphate kinase [Deltaproteobacteria bacterium]